MLVSKSNIIKAAVAVLLSGGAAFSHVNFSEKIHADALRHEFYAFSDYSKELKRFRNDWSGKKLGISFSARGGAQEQQGRVCYYIDGQLVDNNVCANHRCDLETLLSSFYKNFIQSENEKEKHAVIDGYCRDLSTYLQYFSNDLKSIAEYYDLEIPDKEFSRAVYREVSDAMCRFCVDVSQEEYANRSCFIARIIYHLVKNNDSQDQHHASNMLHYGTGVKNDYTVADLFKLALVRAKNKKDKERLSSFIFDNKNFRYTSPVFIGFPSICSSYFLDEKSFAKLITAEVEFCSRDPELREERGNIIIKNLPTSDHKRLDHRDEKPLSSSHGTELVRRVINCPSKFMPEKTAVCFLRKHLGLNPAAIKRSIEEERTNLKQTNLASKKAGHSCNKEPKTLYKRYNKIESILRENHNSSKPRGARLYEQRTIERGKDGSKSYICVTTAKSKNGDDHRRSRDSFSDTDDSSCSHFMSDDSSGGGYDNDKVFKSSGSFSSSEDDSGNNKGVKFKPSDDKSMLKLSNKEEFQNKSKLVFERSTEIVQIPPKNEVFNEEHNSSDSKPKQEVDFQNQRDNKDASKSGIKGQENDTIIGQLSEPNRLFVGDIARQRGGIKILDALITTGRNFLHGGGGGSAAFPQVVDKDNQEHSSANIVPVTQVLTFSKEQEPQATSQDIISSENQETATKKQQSDIRIEASSIPLLKSTTNFLTSYIDLPPEEPLSEQSQEEISKKSTQSQKESLEKSKMKEQTHNFLTSFIISPPQ